MNILLALVQVVLVERRADQSVHGVLDRLAQQAQKVRRCDQNDAAVRLLAMAVVEHPGQFMREVREFNGLRRVAGSTAERALDNLEPLARRRWSAIKSPAETRD